LPVVGPQTGEHLIYDSLARCCCARNESTPAGRDVDELSSAILLIDVASDQVPFQEVVDDANDIGGMDGQHFSEGTLGLSGLFSKRAENSDMSQPEAVRKTLGHTLPRVAAK
jgi:hypothetical protein